jgi:hypothetical protein
MRKHMWGAVCSILIMVAGLWLMQAPFAFGYQPGGASWADATKNDFWVGLAIALVSLIGVGLFAQSLLVELRRAGVIKPRPVMQPPAQPVPAAAPMMQPGATTSELERVLLPMATALLADIAERRNAQTQVPAATANASANGRGMGNTPVAQEEGRQG